MQKKCVEKVCVFLGNCSQNDAKMGSKIDGKSTNFRNLRFLVFCREYNVKIVFLHDHGYRKSIKKRSNIDANSMLKKVVQITSKNDKPGIKMGTKIHQNR